MSRKEKKNDKRFTPVAFTGEFDKEHRESYDKIYQTSYSELVSQQNKRDTLVKTFVAIIAFAVPFSFNSDISLLSWKIRSLIFLALAIIGILFSFIVIRYREYKEAYWLACRTAAIVDNTNEKHVEKEMIQSVFLYCMIKSGSKYLKKRKGKQKISYLRLMRKSIFSAETLYLIVLDFVSSTLYGLSLAFIAYAFFNSSAVLAIIIGFGNGIALLFSLYSLYICGIYKIYKAIEVDEKGQYSVHYFNVSFGKAWTLHTYYDKVSKRNEPNKE